jgi:hypothetical protein
MSEPFSAALRAELDAIVARYEALSRAHQEALSVARTTETAELRKTIATLEVERNLAQDGARTAADRVSSLEAKIDEHQATISRLEQGRAQESADHARRVLELETQLRASKSSLTDAQKKITALEAQVGAISDDVRSLEGAFVAERSFVQACASMSGTPLFESVRSVVDGPLDRSPATYSALKSRGLDALLSAALKDRARATAYPQLSDVERVALTALAQAAGCEVIAIDVGTKFSATTMERAASEPDPAEEGNVLACWIPGLRLAGTDGSIVFPRVLVATG